jgi:hypothetical protein
VTVDVRFQVLTAASMKFRFVFWDVMPCKIIVGRRFRGTFCPDEAARTSETSADNYFTRQYIPEDKSENNIIYLIYKSPMRLTDLFNLIYWPQVQENGFKEIYYKISPYQHQYRLNCYRRLRHIFKILAKIKPFLYKNVHLVFFPVI